MASENVCILAGTDKKTHANEHAASMRGWSVRKLVVANKMETKFKYKTC